MRLLVGIGLGLIGFLHPIGSVAQDRPAAKAQAAGSAGTANPTAKSGFGTSNSAIKHPAAAVDGVQDRNDPKYYLHASKGLDIPIVPDHQPKPGDHLYASTFAIGYPTRDDYVAKMTDRIAGTQAEYWHKWAEPHKLAALDRVRVIEIYPPDERLGINATTYLMVLVEIESGRLKGAYRVINKADIALPTEAGRAMIHE